jgi:hypothetical protein
VPTPCEKSTTREQEQKRQQKILAMVIKKEEATRKQGTLLYFFLFIWKMYAHVLHRWKFTHLCRHSMYVYTGIRMMSAVCAKKNNDNDVRHTKIQHNSKIEIIFQAQDIFFCLM